MRLLCGALLSLACMHAGALSPEPRELVHPYPATGPFEVAGSTPANRVLRAMQRYATPPLTDVLATHVAYTLQGASGTPVVVTRRPRRAGRDAVDAVSSATADGRTLLLASHAPNGLRQVATVASMPYVLISTGDSIAAGLGDLVRHARAAPARSFIASPGEQTPAHAAIRLLRQQGLPIEPLGYNGGYAALQASAAKHVSAALVPLPAALPYLPGGKIKALAIADARRHPAIPGVPTSGESGFAAFEASTLFSVFAPAATPSSIIRELDSRLAHGRGSEHASQTFYDLGLRLEHRPVIPTVRPCECLDRICRAHTLPGTTAEFRRPAPRRHPTRGLDPGSEPEGSARTHERANRPECA